MADRRAELEKKKQKLAQIRAQKESYKRREQLLIQEEINKENKAGDLRSETDQLLSSLGFGTTSDKSYRIEKSNSSVTSKDDDTNDTASDKNVDSLASSNVSIQKKTPALAVMQLPDVYIPPKESVTYTKQTQTTGTEREDSLGKSKAPSVDYYVLQWDEDSSKFNLEWDDEFQVLTYDDIEEDGEGSSIPFGTPPHHHHHHQNATSGHSAGAHHGPRVGGSRKHSAHGNGLPNVEYVKPAVTDNNAAHAPTPPPEPKKPVDLTEEEKKQILLSSEFQRFFNRASRIMERALYSNESADIFIDYTGAKEDMDSEEKRGQLLSLNRCFSDDKWTKQRTVTSFDWCPQYPELLVASYANMEQQLQHPDGLCLVWNLRFKQCSPEYVLTCQSPVLSACFARFHSNLIIGGTYSGQIVLWDTRSNKRTPVQRSPLSAAAHTHPIYCAQMVGTQNSHNLITISTDGRMCSWSLDMMSAAQDSLELNQAKQSRPVAVTSMSFPAGEANNFVLGSEEGAVYSACRHGTKAGILNCWEGHQAPVTSVDFHPLAQHQAAFSHLFLSSSLDWTVKLWSSKEKTSRPLHSFEHNFDYVYDARWSPVHPAAFATADGTGKLDLWNLNADTELPVASAHVEGSPALNRLTWTPNGNQIAVGDDQGRIHLYDVGEQFTTPRNDESSRFVHTLQELKSSAEKESEVVTDLNFSSMSGSIPFSIPSLR